MSTTLVFVELLAAGILAVLALGLACIGVLHGASFPKLSAEKDLLPVVAGAVGIAVVYPVGVLIDALADKLFGSVGNDHKLHFNLQDKHAVMALATTEHWTPLLAEFFEYIRIRIRLIRALLLNIALLIPSGLWAGEALGFPQRALLLWVVLLGALGVLSYWTLRDLQKRWFKTLAVSWKTWPTPEPVAARPV